MGQTKKRHTALLLHKLQEITAGRLFVSGIQTQGDDEQRRFDYTYDNAGRLTNADFKQNFGGTWGKAPTSGAGSAMDFSTNNLAYDLNGNLQSMTQMGIRIGTAGTVKVDDLAYRYQQYTNKLLAVADNGGLGTANGGFGDFKDGTNTGDDYVYDDNGNLVTDLNKNVQANGSNGITYNFLDKPEHITIQGKGTVDILYDADGSKLQRIYKPTAGGSKATTYINGYVYEQKISATGVDNGLNLQFIGFEEGRLRAVTAIGTGTTYNNTVTDAVQINGSIDLPGGMRGAYDFFLRDYQQNVRTILTEETHIGYNTCTMENDRKTAEDPIFQGSGNEVENTRYNTPSGWRNAGNSSASVSRLGNNAAGKIGPNSLLKVMAGDQVTATTDYYYQGTTGSSNTVASSVLNSLFGALMGGGTNLPTAVEGGANATAITGQLGLDGNFNNFANGADNNGKPKAYLNVLFFDERFQFVPENSTSLPVGSAGSGSLVLPNIRAPKNGYSYIYVSNGSDQDVFFDNLKVADERGRLIEEDHYYSYGIRIAGISSKKLDVGIEGRLGNNYLYQGSFSEFDEDLGWNDFALRTYDPQIGRWLQMDPANQYASGYIGMGDDPVNRIDPSGGIDGAEVGGVIVKGVYGGAKGIFTGALKPLVDLALPAIHAYVYSNMQNAQFLNTKDLGLRYDDPVTQQTYYRSDYFQQQKNAIVTNSTDDLVARNYARYMVEYRAAYAALDHAHGQMDFPDNSGYSKAYPSGTIPTKSSGGILGYNDIDHNGYVGKFHLGNPPELALNEVVGFNIEAGLEEGGAGIISKGDFLRIENAATRINKPITVIGSRANGTAGAYSDWDYVIDGLNNNSWKQIKNSLPGSRSILDNTPRNIDIFNGPVNTNLPFIKINPR